MERRQYTMVVEEGYKLSFREPNVVKRTAKGAFIDYLIFEAGGTPYDFEIVFRDYYALPKGIKVTELYKAQNVDISVYNDTKEPVWVRVPYKCYYRIEPGCEMVVTDDAGCTEEQYDKEIELVLAECVG